jgi:hypothetical protein
MRPSQVGRAGEKVPGTETGSGRDDGILVGICGRDLDEHAIQVRDHGEQSKAHGRLLIRPYSQHQS